MHNDINLVNSEVKLLYDIRELLIEQNELLKQIIGNKQEREEINNQTDIDSLKRADLMALVKELPNKPQGWTKLSNDELKALLKDGENK
jgi:hypothetical protein